MARHKLAFVADPSSLDFKLGFKTVRNNPEIWYVVAFQRKQESSPLPKTGLLLAQKKWTMPLQNWKMLCIFKTVTQNSERPRKILRFT
ncbi:MAG: hypothetical protein EA357_10135 [Micavibrio sp.]|nr:MAG: hypothetical protein EA357_10135 [Micavibrio sp.]